jgi:hypothetical protein
MEYKPDPMKVLKLLLFTGIAGFVLDYEDATNE